MEASENTGQRKTRLRQVPSPPKDCESGNQKSMNRSVSFQPEPTVDGRFVRMGSFNFPSLQKDSLNSKSGMETTKSWDGSSQRGTVPRTPLRQYFTSKLPIGRLSKQQSQIRTSSARNSLDEHTGLRLLLSSAESSSLSQASPRADFRRTASLYGRSSLTNDADNRHVYNELSEVSDRLLPRSALENPGISLSGWSCVTDIVTESNSPVFDPTILATFEKALEAANGDNMISSLSSENDSNSSNRSVEATSINLPQIVSVKSERPSFGRTLLSMKYSFNARKRIDTQQEGGLTVKAPSHDDLEDLKKKDTLTSFDSKCPPGGEGRVVLYFTSLHGVRKTFEDSWRLRLILQGFRMHVDERDVWMDSKYRQELVDVLGKKCSVPRLFIKGRYIGGAEEVERLHEEGNLAKLLEGLPTKILGSVCNGCGDVRFIPCLTCSGSCKLVVAVDEVIRCPDCNENGLSRCPICS